KNISVQTAPGSWPASSISYTVGEEQARFLLGVGSFSVNGIRVVAKMADSDLLTFKSVPPSAENRGEWLAVLDAIGAGHIVGHGGRPVGPKRCPVPPGGFRVGAARRTGPRVRAGGFPFAWRSNGPARLRSGHDALQRADGTPGPSQRRGSESDGESPRPFLLE